MRDHALGVPWTLTGLSRWVGVASLAAVMLALSACGSARSSKDALSKSELFAKANAICRRSSIRHDTFDENPNRAYFFSQYAAEKKAEHSELKPLVPPASMASDWGRISTGVRELATDLSKVAAYVKSNPSKPPPASLTTPTAHALEQVLRTAKRDGLKECARTDLH